MMELDGAPPTTGELAALAFANYGHFTSMRVDELRVRGLAQHLERLVRDCRTVFGADLRPERVRELVRQVAVASPSPVLVRVTIFAPELDLGRPGNRYSPRVLVTTRPAPDDAAPSALRLRSAQYRRDLPAVKHTGLFGTVHHRRVAQLAGADDALFVDEDARVLEGATWNVGFIVNGGVVWPAADCLPGITASLLTQALPSIGIASTTAPVRLQELTRATAAFATNASVGVRPIRSIDDATFAGDAALLARLQNAYLAIEPERI
jgi:branched-subunit amino acid aminotransferase/4-amino-4-deoxychorismate lyase